MNDILLFKMNNRTSFAFRKLFGVFYKYINENAIDNSIINLDWTYILNHLDKAYDIKNDSLPIENRIDILFEYALSFFKDAPDINYDIKEKIIDMFIGTIIIFDNEILKK